MDPIQIATDLVTDNSLVVVGLVVALFTLTLTPKLATIAVKRAGGALTKLAGGGGRS